MPVLAIANQKGGVGKTTTTLNLGAALAERGLEILLVDLDPQGALTISLGLRDPSTLELTIYQAMMSSTPITQIIRAVRPHLALAPTTIDLAGSEVELVGEIGRERVLTDVLAPVRDKYDVILLDCPPSLGLLTVNALTAADAVLIPVQCSFFAMLGTGHLVRLIERVRARANQRLRILGYLPTMLDMRTSHSRDAYDELKSRVGTQLIDVPIRTRVSLADSPIAGRTVLEYDPTSDATTAYRQVAELVAEALLAARREVPRA